MEHLVSGRVLMGDSLGFHILFVLFGVGLPLVILILEAMARRRQDAKLLAQAKMWSYVATVLVIGGVLSGTVVALQMFLVWPGILQFGGKAIGLAFSWEGYAFIIEAIFLGFYLKTWDKITGWAHWALMLPVLFGATLSGFLITAVNAWMNHPAGIVVENGVVTEAHPMQAIFTQTTYLEASHSILSYYLAAILVVVAVSTWRLLRSQNPGKESTHRLIVGRLGIIALGLLLSIGVLGDWSAKYLHTNEPTKLAAIEGLQQTTSNAPFVVMGYEIPGLLSWMLTGDTSTVVQGLDATPEALRPPTTLHTLFIIKLALVALLAVSLIKLTWAYLARPKFPRWVLWLILTAPVAAATMIELGWMLTELGRQPYAVYGHVLTSEAFTTSKGVLALAWLFPAAYVVLGIVTILAVRQVLKRFNAQSEKGGAK